MGKPFQSELAKLPETYQWALSMDATTLEARLASVAGCPLIAIGSGGSHSTAILVADLHQRQTGEVGRVDTPWMAASYLKQLKGSTVVLVSGAGRNPDILGVARRAVQSEPESLIALCASKSSPLARIVGNYARGFCFDFDVPAGKDGFLATNSLLALGVVVLKGHGIRDMLPQSLDPGAIVVDGNRKKLSAIEDDFFTRNSNSVAVLYGPDARVAAADLESKLVEAGLVSAHLADYRNFAHGRHHWFAKHPESCVIALASDDDIELARRTLALLPRHISSLLVTSTRSGPPAWVELQVAVFELVRRYGQALGIDPGRPGVPEFGRRIYHLNAFKDRKTTIQDAAVDRKIKAGDGRNPGSRQQAEAAFRELCRRFSRTKFHGLVLDYDGTICDHEDRFLAIRPETARELKRLTAAGFLLGIATGRGQSVRKALRAAIPKKQWNKVWVGYYNGGIIAVLDDDDQPRTDKAIRPQLQKAADCLEKKLGDQVQLSLRPDQVTIESSSNLDVRALWSMVVRSLAEPRVAEIRVLASTRSVDVVPEDTSKLRVLRALGEVQPNGSFMCIGDRPCWPGNDAELLTHEFSLSVDEVDGSLDSVWNLAPAGVLGSAALRYYLGSIRMAKEDFRMELETE
ncbi:MAG: HAD hydrolase family protein [Candidatus Sulfotelmatobacter sp.]